MADAVFISDGERFVATELASGPWDPQAQHGGAPAALLAYVLERIPGAEGLVPARITYEIMRPVPLGPLSVASAVVRPGKRVQLLEASIFDPSGTEVVRARALRVARVADGVATVDGGSEPPPGPSHGRNADFQARPGTMFAPDAIEVRLVSGALNEPGPATAWFRLRVPIVGGAAPTGMQRLAAAADFGNGISSVVSWEDHVFINPDLTIYAEREPAGEWIGLDSVTRIIGGGIGLSESVLYDESGRVGRAVQALVVARR